MENLMNKTRVTTSGNTLRFSLFSPCLPSELRSVLNIVDQIPTLRWRFPCKTLNKLPCHFSVALYQR